MSDNRNKKCWSDAWYRQPSDDLTQDVRKGILLETAGKTGKELEEIERKALASLKQARAQHDK
jgi:hypothetical protein